MKIIFMFFLLLLPVLSLAQVKISVNPKVPIKDESFFITFDCEIKGDSEPEISFDPSGIEILGRDSRGLSTRTVYSMGKLTVTREISYVYEAVAHTTGKVSLNDISVTIDGHRVTRDSLSITIANERQVPLPFFVAAEVDSQELYVGEGVNVRYFLYSKVPISSFDIKKFPKLDGFMKRFLQENDQGERVQVDGEIYRRTIIYSSRLFPEKPGKLTIDPLFFSVTYSDEQLNPFGFGFGRSELKSKEIESKAVEIKVKELPPKPSNFINIVGEHEISLRANNASLMINEPYEFKLIIEGDGALENMESPSLFSDGLLEQFDVRADLKIMTAQKAQKDISYTYIAKNPGEINSSSVVYYTFSPKRKEYIPHKFLLPSIKIVGVANNEKKVFNQKNKDKNIKADVAIIENKPFFGEGFQLDLFYRPILWLSFFVCISAILLLYKIFPFINDKFLDSKKLPSLHSLTNGQGNYGDWLRLIDLYIPGKEPEIKKKIEESKLSIDAKNQLKSAIEIFETSQFSKEKKEVKVKLNKEVVKELKKIKNNCDDDECI